VRATPVTITNRTTVMEDAMGAQTLNAQISAIRRTLEELGENVEQIALAVKEKTQSQTQMQSAKRAPRR